MRGRPPDAGAGPGPRIPAARRGWRTSGPSWTSSTTWTCRGRGGSTTRRPPTRRWRTDEDGTGGSRPRSPWVGWIGAGHGDRDVADVRRRLRRLLPARPCRASRSGRGGCWSTAACTGMGRGEHSCRRWIDDLMRHVRDGGRAGPNIDLVVASHAATRIPRRRVHRPALGRGDGRRGVVAVDVRTRRT